MIRLHNLILFLAIVIWSGTAFHLWGRAWRGMEEEHLAEFRQAIWELKKEGKIREDKDGRLWIKK